MVVVVVEIWEGREDEGVGTHKMKELAHIRSVRQTYFKTNGGRTAGEEV